MLDWHGRHRGFPGESEEQFGHTVDVIKDLKMDVVHLARYSSRAGTVSAETMPDDIQEEEKWRRFRLLEDFQEGISAEINRTYLGKQIKSAFRRSKRKALAG